MKNVEWTLDFIPGCVHGEVEAVFVDVVVNPEEVLQDVSHGLANYEVVFELR